MQLEILALRHQLAVLKRRSNKRPRLRAADRLLWVTLARRWAQWRSALLIFKPETVVSWQRKGFRLYWRWKSRAKNSGRPCVSREIREIIKQMSTANPLWGAPRIHGELLKLGIQLSQATVAKYMVRHGKPPSQSWRTFLENHVKQLFNEASLRRILKAYFDYYEHSRTHLALEKDAPSARAIQPPEVGVVVELAQVGGLHHRYERRAA